ncbi:hypothetical protein [Alloalcanivorax venustensis]|uniref:hypothetical protein n=1 Tax=Alloalcanivorax venustensis TaxID=172371 RepID=UPI0032570B5F
MKTKAHAKFFSRAAHLDADIEIADVVKIAMARGALSTTNATYILDDVYPDQHPRLAKRKNTDQSRALAINHLKATLCAAFLKDVYEDLTMYMRDALEAAALNGLSPNRLIGEHKVTFEANDVLEAGSWEGVVSKVSDSVFRRLENEKSTKKLLQKVSDKLDLGVDGESIEAAMPYLEIRHLLIHNDGIADERFCSSYPEFGARVGHKITLDYEVLTRAREAITALVEEFDAAIVDGGLVAHSYLQP